MIHFTDIHPALQRLTVSREFRDYIERKFPGLGKSPSYWALMAHLMFWTTKSEHEGKLMISQETLASLENKSHLVQTRNYSGIKFLQSFWNDVHKFKVSEHRYTEGLVRVVEDFRWTPDIQMMLTKELNKLKDERKDRVYFMSGEKYSKKTTSFFNQMEIEQAKVICRMAKRNKELLDYFNEMSSNRFTRMMHNAYYAHQEIMKLPLEAQERELKILTRLYDFAQPLYQPTKNSVRIFPFSDNVLALKREVRKAMMKDWMECDLKNAQFAIVAKVWGIPEVNEFLKSGQSIWKHLAEALGVELTSEVKDALKHEFLYPVCFGQSKKNLYISVHEKIELELQIPNAFKTLFNLRLIQAVWKARAKRMEFIFQNFGVLTCFGDWLPLNPKVRKGEGSAVSLLAQEAQSYELKLLLPVLELAKQSNDALVIACWQHDGFSAIPKSNDRYWANALQMTVERQARDLGILTELEIQGYEANTYGSNKKPRLLSRT